jgi:hypothetical protein
MISEEPNKLGHSVLFCLDKQTGICNVVDPFFRRKYNISLFDDYFVNCINNNKYCGYEIYTGKGMSLHSTSINDMIIGGTASITTNPKIIRGALTRSTPYFKVKEPTTNTATKSKREIECIQITKVTKINDKINLFNF